MKTVTAIVLLIIIILGGFYFFSKMRSIPARNNISTSVSDSIRPQPSIDNSDLKAGGSSYSDTQAVYTILYPADYILDTKDTQHTRIYKTGATQKGQTEIYDGVVIVIETIELQGKTMQEWVDDYLKQTTSDGTSVVVKSKKSIVFNNYPGFTYAVRGQGEATTYVLQKNSASNYAVVITTMVSDPENVGYQTEVDKTLSTIDILK